VCLDPYSYFFPPVVKIKSSLPKIKKVVKYKKSIFIERAAQRPFSYIVEGRELKE
jgi:hypothetical protein